MSASGKTQVQEPETRGAAWQDPLVGRVLDGQFRVERFLAEGGMGKVYLAQHVPHGGRVVVKFLSEELRGDDASVARFEREARELSRLRHPNIVTFLGHGQDQGRLYLVMEYIQGITLRQLLEKRGALGLREFLPLALQILDGVGAIHALNIIHRDLKPQNLMVCPRVGQAPLVKILDFGLARSTQGTNIITKRELFGSVLFLSPEQITGHKLNARTDVYALGVLFYMMLTGRYPIQGDSDFSTLTRHLRQRPTPLAEAAPEGVELPRSLCDLVDQCLSKNPRQRPASANVLLDCFVKQVAPEGEAHRRYVTGQRTLPTMSEALSQPEEGSSLTSAELDLYEDSFKLEEAPNDGQEEQEGQEDEDSLEALLDEDTKLAAWAGRIEERETKLAMDPLGLDEPRRGRTTGTRRVSTGEMGQVRELAPSASEAWVAAAVPMGATSRARSEGVRSWVVLAVLLVALLGVGGAVGWQLGWFDALRPSVVERRDLETLLERAEQLVSQGKVGEVERLLASVDARAAQHPDLLLRLGRVRERALTEGMLLEARDREVQGDLAGAGELYERLLLRNPNHLLAAEELKRVKAAMSPAAPTPPKASEAAGAPPAEGAPPAGQEPVKEREAQEEGEKGARPAARGARPGRARRVGKQSAPLLDI